MPGSAFLNRENPTTTVGHAFGTPLVVVGRTWLPLAQIIAWLGLTWHASRSLPGRGWSSYAGIGVISTLVMLGSEWMHNLAHAAAATRVNRPMDALRITWGLPLVIYFESEAENVTPQQHIIRSLGGPLFNLTALALSWLVRGLTRPGTAANHVADVGVAMNAFSATAAFSPIPQFDGGPVLKWALVARGKTSSQAETIRRQVNGITAVGFGLGMAAALKQRRWLTSLLLAQFAILSLLAALGVLKEKETRK